MSPADATAGHPLPGRPAAAVMDLDAQHESLTLGPYDVDVWMATVDTHPTLLRRLQDTLSPDERDRASRFRLETHRARYIFARGVLRQTLAEYVAVEPQHLRFQSNQFGKPSLLASSDAKIVSFNVSHSEGLLLVAITLDRLVGVDVEWIRPIVEVDAIVRDCFGTGERALMAAASSSDKERVFHVCWTRKEAYIKALGKGLSIPLNSFDISAGDDPACAAVSNSAMAEWEVIDLPLPAGYVGALVVQKGIRRLRRVTWAGNSTRLRH